MEKYVVLTKIDGEYDLCIKNTKELAELWESDNENGYLDELKAYQYINGKMTEVNVDKIATEYLNDRREMQKEYEEYTEYVNEYGHEPYPDDYFEEDQDMLEMGFDPYMGCYSDDC